MLHRAITSFALAAASAAQTPTCPPGGTLLGHLPYADAPADDLIDAPAGYVAGQGCQLRSAAMTDMIRLIDASRTDPRVGGRILALSCYRSFARQTAVFIRERPDGGAADRAISVAPAGYSEHGTGYALDFAVRPANGCPDAEACMAATPAARWLIANAPHFGFELSFPGGNRQNVKWEPWHWRWVGVNGDVPPAAMSRTIFACARDQYPANPAILPLVIRVTAQPTPPVIGPIATSSQRRVHKDRSRNR